MLAEWTGLEPATPGVTGRMAAPATARVPSCFVFQSFGNRWRIHAGSAGVIPKFSGLAPAPLG
jgi:hypothetical protein